MNGARPHIILSLVDDWGSYDAAYRMRELGREPDLLTPTLDAFAANGVRLANYYVQPICTPTRASLLSGRYSIHTGSEHILFQPAEPSCLPSSYPLLPAAFKVLGYETAMIGKWHLGYPNASCTPNGKGFDSFLGYYNGDEAYSSHYMGGHVDFHECAANENQSTCDAGCATSYAGRYSTEVYAERAQSLIAKRSQVGPGDSRPLFLYLAWQAVHEPLEAPDSYVRPYASAHSPLYIADPSRRVYAGMVAALDEGLANISQTLSTHGLWNSTILVHSNDNGGMSGTYGMPCCKCGTSCGGLNYPYRGWKDSFWEGGMRGLGLVYAPAFLQRPGRAFEPLLWVGDWYSTLLVGAALELDDNRTAATARSLLRPLLQSGPIDSVNQWDALRSGDARLPAPRSEILLAGVEARVDGRGRAPSGAFRMGRFKLLLGRWGDPRWCDLNRSGLSPAHPTAAGDSSSRRDGGDGGLVCMDHTGPTLASETLIETKDGTHAHVQNVRVLPPPPPPPPPPLPWSELVSGLYDVVADPREEADLRHQRPQTVRALLVRMLELNSTVVPSIHRPSDPAGTRLAQATNCWQPWT